VKVFTRKDGVVVTIMARAEGDDAIGDMILDLEPGQSFLGHPHEFWAALPDGEHDAPATEAGRPAEPTDENLRRWLAEHPEPPESDLNAWIEWHLLRNEAIIRGEIPARRGVGRYEEAFPDD
jgi:hypothetical protein